MKKLFYLAGLVGVLFISSCASDKKDDPNAPEPTTDTRDKFVAYWLVSENSAKYGTTTHTVNIIKSTSNSDDILLNNFSGLSASAKASVNNNILTIPMQTIGSIGFAQGTATLTSATSISFNYTTTINSVKDTCTAIYTKQ